MKMIYPGYGPVDVVGNCRYQGKTYLVVRTLAPSFEFSIPGPGELRFHPHPAGGELMLGARARRKLSRFVLRERDCTRLREALAATPEPAPRSGPPDVLVARAKAALDSPATLASEISVLRAIRDLTRGELLVRDVLEEHARALLELGSATHAGIRRQSGVRISSRTSRSGSAR